MHLSPLPPEEGNSGRPDEQRGPAPASPGSPPGDATDLFLNPPGDPSDDTPTVISKGRPRPASSEDVFSGTLRGRRLAHFELIEPIGVGGMAAVIRARDLQLERQVALKILPPEMAADAENVRRFQQEARAAAKLDHENIARVFFCGEDQKLHFIAFEFVEGQNLRALIERRGRLPVAEAIHYMLQVATGLAHAAERGVIHRDIKPSNIIISPNGRAKLVDMGLARQLGPTLDQGLTQSGVTLGTFDYISPEQALEPRDADVRSDIYSLGCTFYHALTGQPPVPEGTAAKKLHCHQHVAPLDPRQLNPDVPDEVAAILARMMAKDAKARYQRPEHLVQHLMQVAQKLGVSADVPEGVLFVDAPLPAPPRPRPLLLALAAAAGLVVLIVLLGQVPRSVVPPPAPVAPGGSEQQALATNSATTAKAPSDPPPEAVPSSTEGPRPAPPPSAPQPLTLEASAPDAETLSDFLARRYQADQRTHKVQLGGTLDLGKNVGSAGPGLVFDGGPGNTLVIEPKDPKERPVIRIQPDVSTPSGLWAALRVHSGKVVLHGLRFEIDARLAPSITMAALYCEGGRIEVENCEFVQEQPPEDGSSRLSAVEVADAGGEPPTVQLTRCCFLRAPQETTAGAGLAGQNVVTLTARGMVELTDCAFGPHAAVVAFQGAGPDARLHGASASLTHCTALLNGDAAVVRLENVSQCPVKVSNSLFWAPGSAMDEGAATGTLVRQVTGLPDVLGWSGQNNRYYNLAAFWQQPDADEPVRGLAAFREKLGNLNAQEGNSRVLASQPSPTEDPLQYLDANAQQKLVQAFQPDVKLPDLRDGPKMNGLIGVEHLLDATGAYTAHLPNLRKPALIATPGRRVVDPSVRGAGGGVYPTLAAAVADARPGDAIELRFNGPLTVGNSIRLDQSNLGDLTIRPYEDYHPVLVLGPTNPEDEEAGLFRLYDGKLKLEHLQLQLKPSNDTAALQAVVCLVGEGGCSFSDCVVTLSQTNGTRLAAVAVADLPTAMKDNRMPRPAGQHAGASFKNCVVRGDGDLIADHSGRPVNVDADNVLLALSDSVLNLEAAGDDLPATFAGAAAALRLTHVTAYLGGNLVHFRADKDVRGLVPVQVSPSNCLFLAAGGTTNSKALVHLDGPDTSEDRMRQLLPWEGTHNAYTNFISAMLDQASGGSEMPAMPLGHDKWKAFTHETDAVFDRVRLAESPAADFAFAQATPGQFRVKSDPDQQGYGADLAPLALLFPADGMTRADK